MSLLQPLSSSYHPARKSNSRWAAELGPRQLALYNFPAALRVKAWERNQEE
jgi:hypothetical protein